MVAMSMSPTSSPRLPSPPPMAEDQLGPKSPIVPLANDQAALSQPQIDEKALLMRIRPGTKSSPMIDPSPPADSSDSERSYQYASEHLKAVYNATVHPNGLGSTVRVNREMALRLATPPKDVDRSLWLYELSRLLIQKVNTVVIALFADDPPCSAQTCTEMRASEWQYLCAAHDPPKACVPIDYCCHMLDWAANLLTSQKVFARRMISSDHEAGEKSASMKQLVNIMRRVYRIFAHAWFQHRETFWKLESRTGLYVFFKTVCDTYDLISTESSIIPPEAEAGRPVQPTELQEAPLATSEAAAEESQPQDINLEPVSVATDLQHALSSSNAAVPTNTTKRHRQTLSSDSDTIATVLEESEEDYQHGNSPSGNSMGAPSPSEPFLPVQSDQLIDSQATHPQPAAENEAIPHVATSEEDSSKSVKHTETLAASATDADSAANVQHEKEHDPDPLPPATGSGSSESKSDTKAGEPSKSD